MKTKLAAPATRLLGRSVIAVSLWACASCASRDFEPALGEDERVAADEPRGSTAAPAIPRSGGATMQGVATFTAAEVARIVLVYQETAIAQARLAGERGATIEVKTYASRMIRERTEAADRLASILLQLGPRSDDPTPGILAREGLRTNAALAELSKGDFDLPFMTSEIATHARLLGLIDASLVPSASRARSRAPEDEVLGELEAELYALRAVTNAHVVHALRVQGVLRTAGGPDTEGTSAVGTGFEDGPAQP
jgi:predicted outer membrane protein